MILGIISVPIINIDANPWQTRVLEPDTEYIKELALDIARNGLLQIPIGRRVDNRVQLAFGHNRLRAFVYLHNMAVVDGVKDNDFDQMPVDTRELSDEQMAILAWSENEKRRDHTPIERARAIQKRIADFGWTNRQCAEQLGIDHSTVSNILRLLKLPDDVQQLLLEDNLTERQADALLPIYDIPASADHNFGFYSYEAGGMTITLDRLPGIAVEQGWSSDIIRKVVDRYFQEFAEQLKDAEFKLDQMFTENEQIYCGICKTCDRRMASRNLCFGRGCFEAKTEQLHLDYLNQASFVTGYPVDDLSKGGYPTSLPPGKWDQGRRDKIIASKCPSLVLTYRKGAEDFDAYPNIALVCTKRNDSCSCQKGLTALSKEGVDINERMMEATPDYEGEDMEDEDDVVEEVDVEEQLHPPALENQPISAADLEEAARQARKQKMEVNKARNDIREKLAGRLFDDLKCWLPGALFAATHGLYATEKDLHPYGIYKLLARDAARRIITDYQNFDSVDELMKYINGCLEKLQLEPFSLEDKIEPVKIDQEETVSFPEL